MQVIREIVRIKQIVEERDIPVLADVVNSPDKAYKIANFFIGDEDREVLLVIGLNTKNYVNCVHRCHIGAVDSTIIHPREIFKALILNNCSHFIVAHNHPSGELTPSIEDRNFTNRILEASVIMGINLLDSIIVNQNNYFSFKERGYI